MKKDSESFINTDHLDEDPHFPEEEEEELDLSDHQKEQRQKKSEVRNKIEAIREKKNQIDFDDLDDYYDF